ncbi:response regulator [Roseomonas stagni]|uniref:histidine kinase n=1 Tax=Falsiroseomonas algicola TaxID=2716930 RepID=A0A6M1LJX3_9PROT|nr:ATP-binding protein [Falsiroseomonas algicola]NGM20613.1 response regulator [Falsiroseomonas algicola]
MSFRRVSVAILAIAGIFLLSLAGVRMAFLEQERVASLDRAEIGTRELARLLEQYARRSFETAELVSDQVAERVAALGGPNAVAGDQRFHEWLRDLSARSTGDYIMVVDDGARPVALNSMFPTPDVDFRDRRWFQAHLAGARSHVGEALYSRVTREVLFTYSIAIRDADGRLAGAVQIAQRPGFFQQQAEASEIGRGTVLAMLDADGRILARTGMTPDQVGRTITVAPPNATNGSGTLRVPSVIDGDDRIISYRRLPDWPLIVAASVPVDSALAPFRAALLWSGGIVGAVAFGLVFLTAIALRLARREETAREELARANAALTDAATELEQRVAERTRALATARDQLAENEHRFRAIFNSTMQFIGLTTPDGTLLEANDAALAFAGVSRAEVIGRKLWETPWFQMGEATQARLRDAIATAAAGTPQRYEEVVRGGDRLAAIDFSIRPLRDTEGRITLLVPEGHDLTELKAAEARLREAQKMETLGQLTGGVAHDFNNLLMAVLGNLALLKKRLPEDPRLARLVDGALQGAERGAALTQRLLAFARRQELRPSAVDLAGLVGGMQGLLERSVGPGVRIVTEIPPGLPAALVDANQLELALLNLAVNARDAMPGGGTLTVTLAEAQAPSPGAPAGIAPGAYLRLGVRDTGEGMDTATLARAVEPFFTTKGPGRGSGLGLSMVQGLAQQSGGGLALASRPGAGTQAEIWLPKAGSTTGHAATANPAPLPAALPKTDPKRVLVVDDDALVAAGTAMMLEDLGHHAMIARSGQDALAVIRGDDAIDLVLTDYAMPGMNGLDLADQLRRDRPALRVVLATGHAELPAAATDWLPRINKPYGQQDLAALVARLTAG